MNRIPFLLFALALLVAPLGAQAATLSVGEAGPRTISVRYADLPKGSMLSVQNGKGVTVRDGRFPKTDGIKRVQLPKGLSGGEYIVIASVGNTEVARTTFKIAYEAPTCKMTLSERHALRGDSATLRWSSDYAERALIFGSMEAKANGTERIALYQTGIRTFYGAFFGPGGMTTCSTSVRVSE